VASNVPHFLASLRRPRAVLIFSGEGVPADGVIEALLPGLENGDLLMDAGASYFKASARRERQLAQRGVEYAGLGLAGGLEGARHGAVVMAGGRREAREAARPFLEAMAAAINGERCVTYLPSAAAAHFAKMVHAGIERALLQLLSETFDLMQHALLLTDEELHDASGAWHIGVLNGYLMEISGRVFDPAEKGSQRLLLDEMLEAAKYDPTGRWITHSAWELEVPLPTIDAAVGTQTLAARQRQAELFATPFRRPAGRFGGGANGVLDLLHGALHAAMTITYAQGMALLAAASPVHGFHFDLGEISRAWRGCSHLRTTLLDDIADAFQSTPALPNLLCDDHLSENVMARQEFLRHAVWRAHELGAATPGLLASLDYLDSNRGAWLPVNLIQVPGPENGRWPAALFSSGAPTLLDEKETDENPAPAVF
jgi:6-phosphogluconate dehydrogenase